ncbi:MAG: ligand-binding sensor domain-containing protein [Bryobacteraceae bacterium]
MVRHVKWTLSALAQRRGRTLHKCAGLSSNWIYSLAQDHTGQLWAGTQHGLCRLVADPTRGKRIVARAYGAADGLPHDEVHSICEASDGRLWIGMLRGFAEFVDGANATRINFRSYTTAQGVNDRGIFHMMEDRAGNLWLGTEGSGAVKIVRGGFTTYTRMAFPPLA